jgi:hypothetical protein
MDNSANLIFKDQKLQEFHDRAISLMPDLIDELRPVCALLDAYQFFSRLDGVESPRSRELFQRLTAMEMRTPLKRWYGEFNGDMNPTAKELHHLLENALGEKLPIKK